MEPVSAPVLPLRGNTTIVPVASPARGPGFRLRALNPVFDAEVEAPCLGPGPACEHRPGRAPDEGALLCARHAAQSRCDVMGKHQKPWGQTARPSFI